MQFGFKDEQHAFVKRQEKFFDVFDELGSGIDQVFDRECTFDSAADRVVFFMGRLIAEEFMEITLLCANGYGHAALRILRGMYERLVTAKYLSRHPAEANAFVDYNAVHEWKVMSRAIEIWKEAPLFTTEEIAKAKAAFDEAKSQFQETMCKKCGTTRLQGSWTKKSLPEMAAEVGDGFDKLYLNCYLVPTLEVHATAKALFTRMKADDDQLTFKAEAQRNESDAAFLLAHALILAVLDLQNDHFNLGIAEYLAELNEKVLNTTRTGAGTEVEPPCSS